MTATATGSNPIEELERMYPLKALEASPGWFGYAVSVPAAHFENFIRQTEFGLFAVTIRGDFDGVAAGGFLRALDECDVRSTPDRAVSKIEGVDLVGLPSFDCVVILSPPAHAMFRAEAPGIHSVTMVCFPAARCEFSGNETADEAVLMRRDLIDTVNWRRAPEPKIRLTYVNPGTGGSSRGKRLSLAPIQTLLREARNLAVPGGEQGEVTFENYEGRRYTIRRIGARYSLTELSEKRLVHPDHGNPRRNDDLSPEQAIDLVVDLCTKGAQGTP